MNTPLHAILIGLLMLMCNALSAQSWEKAYEDQEIRVEFKLQDCNSSPFISTKVTNITGVYIKTGLRFSYTDQEGNSVIKDIPPFELDPRGIQTADCEHLNNGDDRFLIPAQDDGSVTPSTITVRRI